MWLHFFTIIPLIGAFLASTFRIIFWMRTLRAPKGRPERPDDVPRSTQEAILRFSSERRTRGSSFLTQGFSHITEYLYSEDSAEKVICNKTHKALHEWVRRQRMGPAVRTNVVRQDHKDLAGELAKVEGVTVITTKVRLPVKRPWRPRFALAPGGAGFVKTDLNLHDGWIWTPHDIWEVERPAASSRRARIDALRNRKLRNIILLCLLAYAAQWLAWEEPIVAIALMFGAPALALIGWNIWQNGLPHLGRMPQEVEEAQ